MKKKKIIDAIGLADEKYIAEAAPSKKRSRDVEVSNPFRGERDQREHTALRCLKTPVPTKRFGLRRIVAASLAACFVLITCVLFIPYRTTPPSVARYENSEYYDIIVKLNEANFKAPRQKNRFQTLTYSIEQSVEDMFLAKGAASMDAGEGFFSRGISLSSMISH